ncbi:type 1 glutamine amidotransferase domain-containing protein [Acinetobacter sp. MD2]|uniref:type 1 glutamine amidotransferase domain-containing protein n=1 Tax=Acinetobacter sp. MD2 TaxID=2600066 RepID=UPI002D1EACD5|nr:type 1 glutamine amidotransferase domain-containing protein [Acinetobacter sp. MD2]MEB3766465.1 type 1 glutamine amidotransferase domain-containing protein [Acinetobacter sp. MD2]
MEILMVLTSHSQLGQTAEKTGFWLEEFTAPYYVFKDAGASVVLASPKGGQPPLDPKSNLPDFQTESTRRFEQDTEAQAQLAHTQLLSEINASEFDAVFYPGGHGPLWDLTNDQNSIELIQAFDRTNKPIGLVCHAPAALKHVTKANGEAFVKDKQVTGFSNSEEDAVQLSHIVPFLIEDEFKAQGAHYIKGTDWQSFTVRDSHLITGQNPASSEAVAEQLLKLIQS